MTDVSPQGIEWNPLMAKRPFPHSQATFDKRPFQHSKVTFDKRPFHHSKVTFEKKRSKRPFWRLQPITDFENGDKDYYRIATEKKSNKRPFPHSKVTFQKRPFWRLQPTMDSEEDDDDGNILLKIFK